MLLSNAELRERLNATQDAQVIKWLNERHIVWDRDTKRRPITTLAAIEKHLFREKSEEVDFG